MDNRPNIPSLLALADGTLWPGRAFSVQYHPQPRLTCMLSAICSEISLRA